MRIYFLVFLLLILPSTISKSQILKGKITSQSGEPIKYATVYIRELKQGTTANAKGDYEIRLPAGKYAVTYQSLGYQAVYVNVTLSDKTLTKDVVLPLQYYEIPEVRISGSGEDPAYIIMRKVIGLAPYYLNNISYYKAEVYLKGNLIINRIPKLLQKSMKIESSNHGTSVSAGGKPKSEEKTLKAGDSFLMESFNEMEFTAPDKYFQKVISYNSTFPEQGNEISPMSFIEASFYQPVLADMAISPLSPAAFSHYNFKYLGSSPQGNFTINKIEVIPKRKSQQLFSGTIYIIEDLWCLHSVDLTNENMVGKIRIQQLYVPVENDIWMPVSHKFEINIGIIGFKADAGYGSSVKYLEVRPNLALRKPKTIPTDYTGRNMTAPKTADTVVTKTKKQIDKILEKDQISNRDMVKLARLMEKESERSINDSSKKNLEIKDHTTHVIEKDAAKKDSAYWAEIRPIPLSDIEVRTLKIRDSTKAASSLKEFKSDTTNLSDKKQKSKFSTTVRNIGFGHTWSDTTGLTFTYSGLIDMRNMSFNTVDGFIYGLNFRFSKTWKNSKSVSIFPDIRYAFSRQQFIWRLNANYKFNGLKQRQIFVRTGITSKDIGNGGSINTFLNSATTLFFKKNYLKLYESRYLTFGYTTELRNGLNIEVSAGYEERRVLENTTGFSFIKSSKAYSDNIPVNIYLSPVSNPINSLRNQKHSDITTKVTYTPFQRYRINNGNKIARGSDWPTFNLTWQHGINEFSEMTDKFKQYDMIRFEAFKSKETGAFSEFRWRVRAGGFLNNRSLTYFDFFHFNSQSTPLLLDNYQDAFMIPAFYSLSTPELFGEVHIKYTTPYLLLKLLPVLSNTLMRENLSVSYLGSRYHRNYTEIGYSISEVLLLGEIGVYVGFEDIKYKSVGAKLILRFN
ncbi:MAG: carboxypeptidase-like regulatory domain-containing protein [Bacteroidetes bacterium]|nr:MAG: carboxypeptidase-like regulatory domain-containing protein [Bacteroidota bacterium]